MQPGFDSRRPDHSRQVKFLGEVASGLRPSASPRPALRDAANPHGSEKFAPIILRIDRIISLDF
ncbi:hypothetical protein HY227_00690 [Candidatus Wolfebacteria bacterium]|nr:hypothetical protein [Candidatus Wolfebacteria bacterium]